MEPLIESLRQTMLDTKTLVSELNRCASASYLHSDSGDSSKISEATTFFTKAHPLIGGNANSSHTAAGFIQVPLKCKKDIEYLIIKANDSREAFGELYSDYNTREGTKGKANKALVKAIDANAVAIPYVSPGIHLSTKQIKRRIVYDTDIARITFYKEPQRRIEKVTQEKLEKMTDSLTGEIHQLALEKLANVKLEDIRFIYENKHAFRYRANICKIVNGENDWTNIALSMPIIIFSDSEIGLNKVGDSNPRKNKRTDKKEFQEWISKLNLYVKR